MTWRRVTDHHCIVAINPAALGALACEHGQAQFWSELNRISVELSAGCPPPLCSRTLLLHYPLGRPLYTQCTAGHHFSPHPYTGYPWFLEDRAQRIIHLLKPSLVLSGDAHESCYYEHPVGDSQAASGAAGGGVGEGGGGVAVPEWTVTTFNVLQGTQFPGFGLLSLYKQQSANNGTRYSHSHVDSGAVSFHHCFMCPAIYTAAGHCSAAAVLLSAFVCRILTRALQSSSRRGVRVIAADDRGNERRCCMSRACRGGCEVV
jgi:hypothetical protein